MSDRIAIGLDNSAFAGRLRQSQPIAVPSLPRQQASRVASAEAISDIQAPLLEVQPEPAPVVQASPQPAALPLVPAEPFAQPAEQRQQPSRVLKRSTAAPSFTKHEKPSTADAIIASLPIQQEVARAVAVESSKTTPQVPPSGKSAGWLPKVMFGAACLVFIVGIGISFRTQQSNQDAAAQFTALTEEIKQQGIEARISAAANAAAKKSTASSTKTVAPDEPSTVQIPKLNVNGAVQAVPLNAQGALQFPSGFQGVGWYASSAKPGQPGAVVMQAAPMANGTNVFQRATELVAGDTIIVVRGDRASTLYRVVATQPLAAGQDAVTAAKVPREPGKNGLNIITKSPDGTTTTIVYAEQQAN